MSTTGAEIPATPVSQPAPRRILDRLLATVVPLLQPFLDIARVIWLAGYCTAFIIVGAVFFTWNDQGLDVLRRVAEVQSRGRFVVLNLLFFGSVMLWSLATWYCGRLLFKGRFPSVNVGFYSRTKLLRT